MKRMTQTDKALETLRQFYRVSSAMLVNAGCGYRYGSVLAKLRKAGHTILTIEPDKGPTPEDKNTFWYELEYDAGCNCDILGPLLCDLHRDNYPDNRKDVM